MGVAKSTISGNPYVGAFASASDKFVLAGHTLTHGEEKTIGEALGVKVVRISIDGSDLVGIYAVINSNGILLPEMTRESELASLRHHFPELNVGVIKTDLNALKNNILSNDNIAIVNSEYGGAEIKRIEDVLDVEVQRIRLSSFETVGANNILTNKGIVLNNRSTEGEAELLGRLLPNISQTTANLGSPNIGLCVIANSSGFIAGSTTTGFELARIAEGLGL